MEKEVRENFDNFWKDIVYKDGKLDEEQIAKELFDYSFLMEQAGIVYCEIAGLGKTNHYAKTILSEHNERCFDKVCTQDDIENILNEDMCDADKIEEIKEYLGITPNRE